MFILTISRKTPFDGYILQ